MIDDEKTKKEEENVQNNAKVINVAANVAQNSGEPVTMAVGTTITIADKVTRGKSSELLGKIANKKLNTSISGRMTQKAINKAASSGALDKANKYASNIGKNGDKSSYNNINDGNELHGNISIKIPLKVKIILYVSLFIFLFMFMMIYIILIGDESSSGSSSGSLSFNGYYQNRCEEVTVIFVDSSFNVTGSGTYDMTDYVAGVVAAEVGGFANKEVYKAFALAARTFVELNADNDCSIEGSARRQAFKDITESTNSNHQLIYEAVKETEGQVITSNNSLYSIQYDAFCYATKDSNYYTLVQQDQKIPVEWATKNVWSSAYLNCPCDANDKSMTSCWDTEGNWTDGGHGRGMSQYGALYLATELNYTYDEILSFYYGDENITINSGSLITSIAGLEIKDTRNATELKEPIATYLSSKGTSLDAMNNYIQESVKDVGVGTREGVVTAAVSMINFLYDNFNAKLPYYWGGKVYSKNIPSTFGYYKESDTTRGGNKNYYISFDCSGFVSWSIIAGGYNFNSTGTSGIDSQFSKNSCNISESSCIGQPGDLINSSGGHVELIIDVDIENEKYFVAQSTGSGVVMNQRDMHQVHEGKITKILFLEEYYNNPENINNNY